MDAPSARDGPTSDRLVADQMTLWDAFVLIIWSVGLFLQKLADLVSHWVREQQTSDLGEHRADANFSQRDVSSHHSSAHIPLVYPGDEVTPSQFASHETVSDRPVYFIDTVTSSTSTSVVNTSRIQYAERDTPFNDSFDLNSSLDQLVLRFCRLDAPGYRVAVHRYQWRFLSFRERLRVERMHFQILLLENLRTIESSWRPRIYYTPSYVLLRDCPPDYTESPSYYDI